MTTASSSNERTVQVRRNPEICFMPCGKKSTRVATDTVLTDHSWPFICSFALHSLLFAALCCRVLQYPTAISADTLTVFWLPAFASPGDNETSNPAFHRPSLTFARQNKVVQNSGTYKFDEQGIDSQPSPPVPAPLKTAAALSDKPVETRFTQAKPLPATHSDTAKEALDPPSYLVRSGPLPVPTALKNNALPLEPEPETQIASTQALPPKLQELPLSGRTHHPEDKSVLQNESQQNSARTVSQTQSESKASQREIGLKDPPRRAVSIVQHTGINQEKMPLAPAMNSLDRLTSKIAEKPNKEQHPSQQNSRVREVAPPIVKGDLKLVALGTTRLSTSISFKEFPQSRRNRPFSRSETERAVKIIPKLVPAPNNSVEIVIEQARAGVYTFTVEPVTEAVNVFFSLKIYDGTARKIIKELGKQNPAQNSFIVKLLMPEGILWDDTRAFTGNIEDAESVTRFNAATGLMWKEYTD